MSADAPPIRFGWFLVPNAEDPLLVTARRVERLGLDVVGIQDHPYQRRYVDTWSLMAMVAATTTTLRVFPDVANLPLRPPAVLAKTAATIDRLSGGRFELGLGAGALWDAIAAYGGPRRSPGESLEALEEAIAVIRLIWSGERGLRFAGEHYRLTGAHGGPEPAHPIGIWLGAYRPPALRLTRPVADGWAPPFRRELRLTGRVADGWAPSFRGELEPLVEMTKRLDDAIDEAGRSRADLRRILNISGTVTDGASEGPFHGPAGQWVEDLAGVVDGCGFDT